MRLALVILVFSTWQVLTAIDTGVTKNDLVTLFDDYIKYMNRIKINESKRKALYKISQIDTDDVKLTVQIAFTESDYGKFIVKYKSIELSENEVELNTTGTLFSDRASGDMIVKGSINGTEFNDRGKFSFWFDRNNKNIWVRLTFDEKSVQLVEHKVTSLPPMLVLDIEKEELKFLRDVMRKDMAEKLSLSEQYVKDFELREQRNIIKELNNMNKCMEGKTFLQVFDELKKLVTS